jgi:hypothetical protein
MPLRSSSFAAVHVLFGVLVSGLVGCQTPGATRIVGPDGSPMAHVHCGSDQGACFRLAGQLCPAGYAMQPVLRHSDGNFLIRCRAAAAVAGAPPCASPSAPALALSAQGSPPNGATVTAARSTRAESWPPSSEPSPAAYPWPPAEGSERMAPIVPAKPGKEVWDPGF